MQKTLMVSCSRCQQWSAAEFMSHVHASREDGAYECCMVVCARCAQDAEKFLRRTFEGADITLEFRSF